jgi:hypothetical protein
MANDDPARGYASRFDIQRDDTWIVLKLQEEVGERGHSGSLLRA